MVHFPPPAFVLFMLFAAVTVNLTSGSSSRVRSLPGFNGSLPFELYTGYIDVGDNGENHLFFYFVKSERNPEEDPLLLWLTGGPGCSGFSGLAFETGPLKFERKEYDGSLPTLVLNPISWTKVSNVIFLDSPTGTGFSYSDSTENYRTVETATVKHNYMFLQKWLEENPEFLLNPFYIGGDSHSGITVPLLAHEIAKGNKARNLKTINLKGYLVGNPKTDPEYDALIPPFAHGMGLISDELYKQVKRSCKGKYDTPNTKDCITSLSQVDKCLQGVEDAHILYPKCLTLWRSRHVKQSTETSRELEEMTKEHNVVSLPPDNPSGTCMLEYLHVLAYYWTNHKAVRVALNVHEDSIREWVRCNWTIKHLHGNDVVSTMDYHKSLTRSGFRALVYSGDHDLMVPFSATYQWISSLNYSVVDGWRPWWVNGQIAGYTESFENHLTFATVKGAGHTAPEYKPKECLAMVQRWLLHEPL